MQPPPRKKPRLIHAPTPRTAPTEEISFNPASRHEYLTGFHRRKLARAKLAREIAGKKEREEKLRVRREVREGRRRELEERVGIERLRFVGRVGVEEEAEDEEWNGVEDGDGDGDGEGMVDREEEYIDEEKFTTVLVEEVDVDRDGLHKHRPPNMDGSEQQGEDSQTHTHSQIDGREAAHESKIRNAPTSGKRKWTKDKPKDLAKPKTKKKKFRYESKAERKVTRGKEKMKNRKQASARRKGE